MKSIPLQTEVDFTLVKQYVILPIVLDVLERDMQTIGTAPLKMPMIYVRNLRHVQNQVHEDLVRIRKQLRAHGLKVYEEKRTKIGVEVLYICRGYHHTFSMLWSLVKAEVERYLSEYLNVDLNEEV
ncbi:hypothetical protein BVG16_13275 [Paenibacillus selenitireducens]|jgi:hypothetical protein|uniref:Uncharacterized protein n=1 Tax=Paenibacillus selenitireducens TaxID=1324314 RepID=A0A1T2XCL5_9BACL|nr:hypothetical protein [Paenibacillus selenitireducens]OPA77426.1 hypothetical protein BVG16_13275 [Paenibacillus selenitireducens]